MDERVASRVEWLTDEIKEAARINRIRIDRAASLDEEIARLQKEERSAWELQEQAESWLEQCKEELATLTGCDQPDDDDDQDDDGE